jgi:hypothetical protein
MKRVFLWTIASCVIILLVVGYLVNFFTQLGTGFVGSVQACGVNLQTGEIGQQPANSPVPDPSSTPVPTPTPTSSPSTSDKSTVPLTAASSTPPTPSPSAAPAVFGPASTAYFNQFSASQQAEMKKIAALIVSIGKNRPEKLSRHDIEAAIGVAIQESNLTNLLIALDHDSLGVYQQRPSVGSWGTAEQIVDPTHATNKFYDAMVRIPAEQRQSMALIDIGITVQIPNKNAYRSRWAWDEVAKEIVSVYLTGSGDVSGALCAEAVGVSSGDWQLPLTKDTYCLGSKYGMRFHPIWHEWRMHYGIDFSCNSGNPIYAIHDGTVIKASYSGGLGNYVEIDHGENQVSGYAHMVRYADGISVGDTVKTGQVIGYVGSTGDSTGPHLHFQAKVNGKLSDPEELLKKYGVTLE